MHLGTPARRRPRVIGDLPSAAAHCNRLLDQQVPQIAAPALLHVSLFRRYTPPGGCGWHNRHGSAFPGSRCQLLTLECEPLFAILSPVTATSVRAAWGTP